jgi:hypothetical protein
MSVTSRFKVQDQEKGSRFKVQDMEKGTWLRFKVPSLPDVHRPSYQSEGVTSDFLPIIV